MKTSLGLLFASNAAHVLPNPSRFPSFVNMRIAGAPFPSLIHFALALFSWLPTELAAFVRFFISRGTPSIRTSRFAGAPGCSRIVPTSNPLMDSQSTPARSCGSSSESSPHVRGALVRDGTLDSVWVLDEQGVLISE